MKRSAIGFAVMLAVTAPAIAQISFYEHDNFEGRTFTTDKPIGNFERFGFNDRASSVVVTSDRWEVCEEARFNGRCIVLRPGRYPSLSRMGMNDRISSVREVGRSARIDESRYAPAPVGDYDYGRRRDERLFTAEVIAVRAVVGPPERRCWIEHEKVVEDKGNANVGGAIAGALLGGIIGHQVGNGRGNDIATAGGAVAGAAIGANVGRGDGGQQTRVQDVQRCTSTPSQARPEYWDVTYKFRGQEHRTQMTAPPGPSINVNERGEPRI